MQRKLQRLNGWISGFFGLMLVALSIPNSTALAYENQAVNTDGVEAPVIHWTPCVHNSGFDCAKVQVPLDYRKPKGKQIELTVIRIQAADPSQRIGSLLMNPGGPGGLGTESLPNWLKFFPPTLRQRFDLVSWDPRGIGESTPVQCFENQQQREDYFRNTPTKAYPEGKKEVSLWLKKMQGLAKPCREQAGELLDFVSTADTARDLEILRRALGEEKLNYLGLSYGSFLGATYANLYPDKIRAMVLDGNINPEAWMKQGPLSLSLRLNSDIGGKETLDQFLKLCGGAGQQNCAFAAESPEATAEKWHQLLKKLEQAPVSLPKDAIGKGSEPVVITHARMVAIMATQLSFVEPLAGNQGGWKYLAHILQVVWENLDQPATRMARLEIEPKDKYQGIEQGWAVQCVDSSNPHRADFYRNEVKTGLDRAGPLGAYWVWNDAPCVSWPGKAATAYSGPWNHPTSAPILLIGNRYDPETIYSNTLALAKELANPRVLTVEGYGHTAFLNPSDCANEAMSRYFVSGELPPEGKVCPQNHKPF